MRGNEAKLGFWRGMMVVVVMLPLLFAGVGTPFGPLSDDLREEALERQDAVLIWLKVRPEKDKFGTPGEVPRHVVF